MIPVILSEIQLLPVWMATCYFRLSVNVVLFVHTFLEFGVVEDFVYRARITVILILRIYSAIGAYESVTMTVCSR